ncbi:hypothetical protein niasHT_009692 [Heterodera trifolii]|uniref:Transposase n=1 Tax=Heterodera trifolii TaxID=157864 RepID=A0ABD2MFU1_9BILA
MLLVAQSVFAIRLLKGWVYAVSAGAPPKKGIQIRLLDLECLPGETSEQVFEWIKHILKKHKLNIENLVAFCGDNTPANFGSSDHTGTNNVFQKLKSLRGNLITVGCPAHVLHNAARRSADNLPIDIEKDKMILPELLDIMSHFKVKIKDRMDKQFFGIITGQLLRRLPEQEEQMLKNAFTSFYKKLASTFSPDWSDTLFDEISQVNHILNNIDEAEFVRLTTEQTGKEFSAQIFQVCTSS